MKISIAFKHLEHTPSLDQKIREKTEKFSKYFDRDWHCKWTCYVKEGKHFSEVEIIGAGNDFHAKAHADNLYKTFDIVYDKLEKQLVKKKEKSKNRIHKHFKDPVCLDPEVAWAEKEDVA